MRVKYWEIIADNLSKAGWSWGCVSAIDSNGAADDLRGCHGSAGRVGDSSGDDADSSMNRATRQDALYRFDNLIGSLADATALYSQF